MKVLKLKLTDKAFVGISMSYSLPSQTVTGSKGFDRKPA